MAGRVERLRGSRALANLSALTAAVLFGGATVATRAAVRHVPPFTLGFLRFAIGATVLVALLLSWKRSWPVLRRGDYVRLALLGGAFFGVFPLLFNSGLRLTEASRGAVVMASMPLASLLLARALRHERLASRQVGGVVCTFVGVALIFVEAWTMGSRSLPALGDAMLLGCAVLAAVYGVFGGRLVGSLGPLTVTAVAMLAGSSIQLPAAALEVERSGLPHLTGESLALVAFLGVIGGAAAYLLWTAAFSRLTPTQVAVYINVNPLVAALLAWLFLGERVSVIYLIAAGCVTGGILLVNWPGHATLAAG